MKTHLLLLALSLSFAMNLSAQTDNTAPVVWEPYRHSDLEVSVNLPKMPNVIGSYDSCSEELKRSSYAYAEGAVYEFTVLARISQGVRPRRCPTDKPPFDQTTIDRRLDQLRQTKGVIETNGRVANLAAYQFQEEKTVRLIVPDVTNKRWIELAVTHYPKELPDLGRFFDSLQLDAVAGKEIGNGAERTLGDPVADGSPSDTTQVPESLPAAKDQKAGSSTGDRSAKVSPSDPSRAAVKVPGEDNGSGDGQNADAATDKNRVVTPFQIAAKPHARYTDLARKNGEKGTVRLKVTLQTNGAVGAVTPITALKDGLTEQAMFAARRIVFLPKRINGKPVNGTISVEYSFSIY